MGRGLEEDVLEGGKGLELLEALRGVSGGVAPFPFARLSPIAFTNSLTETPSNSGGTSLGKNKAFNKFIRQIVNSY